MHTSIFLALTFFGSIDTMASTPAQKDVAALLTQCEASKPDCTSVAIPDGNRIIVLQSPDMAVEIRAARYKKAIGVADLVAGLATHVTGKKSGAKQA